MSNLEDSADAQATGLIKDLPGITYHTYTPLNKKGYARVSQIAEMSVEELHKIVPGKKSLRNLLAAIGREWEFEAKFGPDVVVLDDEFYEIGPLRQLAGLTATAKHFRFATQDELREAIEAGERVDPDTGQIVEFTWVDIARYRRGDPASTSAAPVGVAPTSDIDDMMAEYARDFDTSEWTGADVRMLRNLAAMEVRLEALQDAQIRANAGTAISDVANKERTDEIIKLAAAVSKLRDDMEISLKSRAEARAKSDSFSAITDLASRGKRLLAERASFLQHCGVLQGLFLPNFPRHITTDTITATCAVCGQPLQWKIVTDAMLEIYEEAGSFVPDDAPPGMLERKK